MNKAFPEDFLWGTAISSFQCEMGLGEPSDKTDWWVWVHDEENIREKRVSGETPLHGPGFWELYDEDFSRCRDELGCNSIRLAIDWGRVFPESTVEIMVKTKKDVFNNLCDIQINSDEIGKLDRIADSNAIEHYREIIKSAIDYDLTPLLTLYHWPIPLWLHDPVESRDKNGRNEHNGWLSKKTITEFAKYSAYIAHKIGDLVDLYCTINEPRIISEHGYLTERGEFPPGLNDPELFILCMKHVAIAHGLCYMQVKKWDKTETTTIGPTQAGLVSVLQHYDPADPDNQEDIWMNRFIEYVFNEWNLNAVFHGDYDMNLNMLIEPWEQLPHLVKGCDFLGINYYSRWKVKHRNKNTHPLLDFEFAPCTGDCSDYNWEIYPQGIRNVLNWAYKRYRRPIYITKNGIADSKDNMRTRYVISHLEQIQKSISEDGVPVKGYYYWTLMDNFEWSDGYKMKFGLYKVNKKTKSRGPTKAVKVYREIAQNNKLQA